MEIKRHYLVEITDKGRAWAYENLDRKVEVRDENELKSLIVEGYKGKKIPGIMRRDEENVALGVVPVGFASPWLHEMRRTRVAAHVPKEEILKVITPYDLLKSAAGRVTENPGIMVRTKCLRALRRVTVTAAEMGLKLGVWGSAALELATELPYTHDHSDLDLLMDSAPIAKIKEFLVQAQNIVQEEGCKLDLELDVLNGYGIKAVELFMQTDDVLGKSIDEVKLIPKRELWSSLEILEDR